MRTEIAVTGWGLVSALGLCSADNLRALYAGQIQERHDDRLHTSLRDPPRAFFVQAPLEQDFAPVLQSAAGRLDGLPLLRTSKLGLWAAREALAQAALGADGIDLGRIGVAMGTTVGCAFDAEDYYRACLSGKHPGTEAMAAFLGNDLATVVAALADARGPRATVVNACASATDAIGLGAMWIDSGQCDVVLAGGADALHRVPFLGFGVLRNTSSKDCRPFDLHRNGLNLGEGAGLIVLERAAHARARAASILGYVAGYATAADAHHPTAPHPDGLGLRRAIRQALADAELTRADIGFVHAHGTGTTHNDRVEGRALGELLSPDITLFSSKGYTGHTMGAAGALGAVFALSHLRDALVPASAGFQTPDPECLVVPTTHNRPLRAGAALCSSLAFGGTNSVLVLRAASAGDGNGGEP